MIEGHGGRLTGYDGGGLERSCARDRWTSRALADGVELLQAWFAGHPYARHRHDSYAIGMTVSGIQKFGYRGVQTTSGPGDVFVLHPDEMHDGRAGDADGFGYRQFYVAPWRIAEAARGIAGRPGPFPFSPKAVSANRVLAGAIEAAFRVTPEPMAIDGLVLRLTEGLMRGDPSLTSPPPRLDGMALERARQFLDAECRRVVRSSELETVSGLTRYTLARQFRRAFGTSPYRYLTMRRLDNARDLIRRGEILTVVALEMGFSDQAHFTRAFKSAYGMTPSRYAALERTHWS